MATEAETPEHISAEKTEAREIICGQLEAVSHQKFSEELQKVEDRYTLPPETFDYTTKDTDSDIAQDFKNVTVNPANQGENCISRSGNYLESPSVVVATSEESCKSSKDIAEEVKLVLKNTEALENDSQKQKDQAKESLEATEDISESNSACGQKVSTEPSLENVTAQKTGLAKSSELSTAENEVGDYIGEKPSPLPIIFSSASLGLQEERLVSRDGELLEIKKQKEELLDATQDPIGINDQQLPDSSVTVSNEKPLTETCQSQNIEEKAGTSLQKDETVGNNSYEGPGIEFGEDTLQDTKTTLGEDKEEASPTPDLINENLQTDPSIRGQSQNMEEDIYKTVEEEAYNKEGGINSNLNIPSIPIKYEEELSSSQEKKLKETEESSSTITGPVVCLETIGQKQETEHEKNESATDSLAISMAMTSPKIHKNEEETLEIDENTTHEFVTTTPTMVIDETSSLKPEAQISGPPASAPGVSLEERNQETTESSKTMDDDNSVEDEIQVKSSVIITERAEIIDGEVDEHRSQKEKSEVEELIRPIEDVNEGLEAITSAQFEKTGGETYRRNKNPEAEDSGEKIETELVIEEDKNVAQKELESEIIGKENFVEASKSKITGATVTEQSGKFGELDSEDKLKSVSLKMSRNEYTTEEECTDSCLHKGTDRIRLAGGGEDVNKQTDDDVNYQESIKTFEDNENDKSNIQVETTEVRYENQAERAQDPDEKTSGISSEKINEKLKIADEGESTQKHLIEEDRTVNVLTTIVKAEEEETKETKEEVYKELMTKTADLYNDNQNIGEGGAIEVNYTTPTEDENEAQMPKSEVLEIANTEKDIGEQIVVDSAVKDVSITATGEEKEVIEIDQDDEVHENLIDSIQDEASQKQIKEDVSDTVFSAKAIGEKPVEMISEEYEDSKGIETYVADKETAGPVVELTSTVSVAEETTISNSQKDENHTMKQNAELGFETPNSTQEKGANLKDEEIYVAPQAVDSKETTDEETFPKESSEELRDTSSLEPNVCNPGIEDGILEHEESATDEFKTTDKTKITDNTNSDETELKCDNLILVPKGLEVSASSTNVDSTVEKEHALTSILSERSKEDKEGSETKVGEEGIQSEQILTSTGLAFMEQNVKPVDSSDETGNMQVHGQIKHVDDISTIHPLAEETVQEVGHESAKGEGKLQEQIRAPPQEQEHILELFEGNKRTDIAMSEQETDLVDSTISEAIQTNETEPMEVEKASESDCKEELENIEGNDNIDDATSNNEENSPEITCRDTEGNNTGEDGPIKSPNTRFLSHESVGLRNHKPEQTEKIGQWAPDMKGGDQIIDAEHGTPSGIYNEDVKVHDRLETRDIGENKVNKNEDRALDDLPTVHIRRDKNEAIHEGEEKEAKKPDEEVDDRLEATGIDDQIEKEVVHDAGDATEHLSMPAGEKTITREEPVEDRIEGDRKKVYEELETNGTDDHIEKQIKQEDDGAVTKHFTVSPEEKPMQENSLKDEKVAQNHEEEVGDELETGDVGEDKVNKTEVCALDDLPIVSIREDKNEGMPKGDEKKAKKPDEEVEDRLKATAIDDQIKKEVVHEDGDVIEKHNMLAGEETITKGESVEDRIEGDKKEVYEGLETTSTDDHNAKQIKHEDRVVQEHLTVSSEEKPIQENSTTDEKVAQNHEEEVHDGLEIGGLGEDKGNKMEVCALYDLPTISIRENKNERIPEGEEKEAKKPGEEVDDRLEATGIDDQIEKEVVHDAGDATELLSMVVEEETITRKETVEDRKEGDGKEVYEELETTGTDDYLEKQIKHEDGAVTKHFTMSPEEKPMQESSLNDEKVAQNHEEEVGDELETGDVGEDKVNKTGVCALDDLPIVSIREDKNEGMPEGEEKEAKKPGKEVEDRHKATVIDDQIEKEVAHEDGDIIEKHSMPVGEETITREETVEDKIEGDKQEVYEALETTSADDHIANQIKHEDGVVPEYLTVSPEEKPIQKNSTKDEKVAPNHEEEVRDGLETKDVGENKRKKTEVRALDDLPTISIREDKNEGIPEGGEKEAKKPSKEVDDRLEPTSIDDQIEKEGIQDVGDATELLSMYVEEETITREETVEDRSVGDKKEVYEELETTGTDDHLEKQIKHEDGVVLEHFTMSPEEKLMQESSLKDEKVAQNHKEEVGDELETGDVGEDKVNKTEVCALDDLPTVSIREDKNEGMPEGEEKEAKKPGEEVEDRHKATVIDDQIEKEVVHEDGDVIEKHSMPVGEETITRGETVEDKIEGDKNEVYEALETTSTDDHIANQIKHEDRVVPEHLTVSPEEKPIQENSTKDEKVAPNREEEVRDGLEIGGLGEDKGNKTKVCALYDLPTISIRENKNEGIPKGEEKEAKKPGEEVDDRLEEPGIDDQIEKEVVHDVGDATELLSMSVEEETITRKETVEDRIEGDGKEVYEELETTDTDDHLEKQIKHEDGAVTEHFTMSPEEKPMQESSLNDEKVAQNHEEEVGDELETSDVDEDKVNKTEVCALDDLPTVSIREDKNEGMPEGEEKEAKKPSEEVEDRHKATFIDDQIEKEVVHEDGDVIEKHSMPVGEETIFREETVEDRIEGDKQEVYEELKTTGTNDHIEEHIKHEDRAITEHFTMFPKEKPIQENSLKDEKMAQNHKEEVHDGLETEDVGEDKVNKKEVCALDDLPTISNTEDKNEVIPEGEKKEPNKLNVEVDNQLEATSSDNQIEKEVVYEDGDVTEHLSMPAGEEIITRGETVENKIEGDEKEVYEELETTSTDDHLEKQIIHEDEGVTKQITVSPGLDLIEENSPKDEKVEQNHEKEVFGEIDTATVVKDAEKNITEDVVFMKPFTASTEEQIQERLETGITAAVEKQAIQVATTIQPYTVSLGEETIDESSKKDELYQEPNTICAREDAGDTIMKDGADEDAYVVSVGEYKEDEKNGTTQEEAKESDSGSPDDGTDSTKKTDLITLEDEKDTTMSLTAFSPTEGPPEKIAPKENIDDRYHASPVSKELEEQMKEIPEKCDNEGHKHDEIGSAGTESEEGKLVDASNLASGQMTPAASGAIMINSRALDVEDVKLDRASDLDKNESKEIILKEISEETDAKQDKYQNPELASVVVLQSVSPDIESITIEEVIASKSFSNEKSEDNSQHSLLESNKYEFETVKENEKIEDEIPVKTEPRQENLETPLVAEEMHMQRENLGKFEKDSEIESRDIEKQSLMPELELENHSLVSKDNTLKRGESTEVTEFDEKDKPETSEPGLEENQSEVNDQFDLLLNKMQKEDSITEEGQSPDRSRNELIIVEEKLDEIKAINDSHENRSSNTINNLTETLEANDLGEKPRHKCSPEELPKTEETGMDKETKNIKDQDTVCVENKMDSQCSQEDEKEGKNLKTEYKLDPENKKDSTTDVSDFGQDIETKNEESDAKEITLVSIGEKAIEDNSVDKKQESNPYEEVSRGLETTCTDEHTEQESIKEHGNVTEHFTVNIGEKATGANSQKGEIQEHEEEVSEDLDLGKDGQNNIIEETDLLVGSTIRSKEEVQEDDKEAKKPQKELYKVYPELETANKSEDIGKEGVEEDDAVEVHNTVFTAQERMEDDAVEVHNTVSTAQERVEKDDDVEVHNTVSTAQEILRDSSQEDEEVAKAIGEVIQSDSSSGQNNEAKCGKENAETENWSYFERLIKKANSYPATEASGEEILDNADSKKLKDVSSAASEITEEIITEDISREVENIGDTGKDDLDKDEHLKNSEIISTQDQENAGAVNLEIETVKLENPEKTIDEVQNFTITPSPDQETIVGEFGGDCEVASKFEGDKLERASESMSEARVYETPILAEKSEHYTVGSIAERHNTLSVGGENNGRGYEEGKKEEETLTEAESNLEAGDKQNKETNEVTEIRENQTENQEVLVPGEKGSATENIQISRDEEANKESYVLVSTATTIQEIHSENEKKGDKIKEESTSSETDKQTHEIEADEDQRVPEEFKNIDASNSNPKEITGEEELIEDAEFSAKKRVQERHQGDAEEVNIQPNKLEIGIPCQESKSESGETNEYMEEENVREKVSKSHENDTASQNIEEQVKKEKESLQGMYLKPMSEETIEPVHQEYKMDGEIDKDEAPKVGIEYQDPGLSYTCHTIENEEVKRSEQLVEPYIETEDPTTKGETTTITDGEECQIDTTTPARHATSNDAPYEPAKKLKEQSDLLPEEPIHESIRENPDDEGKANKNVSGGKTKLDSEKLSEITPSPTTTTKELLMDDNHGASSLIRTSEKEMQGKQGETAKVEEKERPVFVEQVTEVNLAAETRGETDKDEALVEEKVDSALKKLNECSIQEGISPTEEETQTLKKDTPQDTEMLTETLDLTTEKHTHGEIGLTEDRNLEFSVKNTDIPSTPVGSVENTKAEISFRSTDIPSMPVSVTEKSLQISEVEDQQHGGESLLIGSELKEVDSGRDKSMPGLDEETIAKLKSETVNVSSSHLLQESTEDTMQMVGHSVDEGTPSDNKEKGNKEAPTTQNEEEEEDDGEKQKYQEGEEQDENKMVESGSDAPVMVEASRDIDVKPAHKKSHNILSGVGSKVKQSISKVKKAITGKSSHHKQLSPK